MKNLRNFFINIGVDDRQTDVATGPKSKDGGMSFTMYQNDDGNAKEIIRVYSTAHDDGTLVTTVWVDGIKHSIETKR